MLDSLVIDTSGAGADDGELLCFRYWPPGRPWLTSSHPSVRRARRVVTPECARPVHRDHEVPRTLNGKKCEVPVKKILAGVDPGRALSSGALRTRTRCTPSWPCVAVRLRDDTPGGRASR